MTELMPRNKNLLSALTAGLWLGAIAHGALAQSTDELVPVVRIKPQYPPGAAAAGREGEVELEFTIAANGTIRDVVVVGSSAPEFEEPAIAALLRWRYLPTNMECVQLVCRELENVPAVERYGVRTVISYRLGDALPQAGR